MSVILVNMHIVCITPPKNSGNIMQSEYLLIKNLKSAAHKNRGGVPSLLYFRPGIPNRCESMDYSDQPSMMGANLIRMFGSFVIVV